MLNREAELECWLRGRLLRLLSLAHRAVDDCWAVDCCRGTPRATTT